MLNNKLIKQLKDKILGEQYELSFAFISRAKIKKLNKKYRKKDEATDVLSFPFSKNFGEILICKSIAKKKAPDFSMDFPKYLLFLVIHACLHLKGFVHGVKMQRAEKKFLKIFS